MCGPQNIQLYLHLFVILPATLTDVGATVIPGALGVQVSIGPIIAPALLTMSCLRFVPARVSVAPGLTCITIPARSGLCWVLLVIVLEFRLCSRLCLLKSGVVGIVMGL